MKDIQKQFDNLLTTAASWLKPILRHHAFIFTILILFLMIVTVFRVNQQLRQPSDDAYRSQKESEAIRTTFDQTTIDRIKQLRRGTEGGTIDLGNRTRFSPFIE
jgi:hypothetical protein